MSYYYRAYNFLFATSPSWQNEKYGFKVDGLGDLIFRTMLDTIISNDRISYYACLNLLEKRLRWPNLLDPPKFSGYRSQKSMTRDPFIMHLVTGKLIGVHHFARLPILLNRFYYYNFKMHILTGDNRYKNRFEWHLRNLVAWGKATGNIAKFFHNRKGFIRGLRHKFGIHSYSLHLWAWMAYSIDSNKTKGLLFELIPNSNLLARLLVGGSSWMLLHDSHSYVSREGYQWVESKQLTSKAVDPKDPIKLDKDLLEYLLHKREPTL